VRGVGADVRVVSLLLRPGVPFPGGESMSITRSDSVDSELISTRLVFLGSGETLRLAASLKKGSVLTYVYT
jgi:hypothetical protein